MAVSQGALVGGHLEARRVNSVLPQLGRDPARDLALGIPRPDVEPKATETIAEFHRQWEDFQFSRALETAWSLVSAVDKYIVETQPWAVAEKTDDESRSRLGTILYTAAEALRIVTALAHPVLPESTAKI